MKKLIYLLSIAILVIACGGEEEAIVEDTVTDKDTSNTYTEEIDVENEALRTFETIEEYCVITSKDELYDLVDEENLEDGESWYAEGTVKFETTTFTNPANGHIVKYVWKEENSNEIGSIEFHATIYDENFEVVGKQEIYSYSGLYTGMTFEELKTWNGAPFEFSGFGWDYAGGVMPSEESRFNENPFNLTLDIDYSEETYQKFDALIGDAIWSSDAKETKGAPIFLGTITYWPPFEG